MTQPENSKESFISIPNQSEDRISELEDKVEDIHQIIKEYKKVRHPPNILTERGGNRSILENVGHYEKKSLELPI